MKRWYIWVIACTIIGGGILALTGSIQNPADFTGKWYYAEDSSAYLFHNGIIINEKHHLSMDQEDIFSGAYSFGKNKILLFFINADGVEQIKELQLVSHISGDVLCEVSENMQNPVFYRNKDIAKTTHEK